MSVGILAHSSWHSLQVSWISLGPFSGSLILILTASFQHDLGPVIDSATPLPLLSSAGTTMLCPCLYVWDRCPAEASILFVTSCHSQTAGVHH